jgi:hypothetical protein
MTGFTIFSTRSTVLILPHLVSFPVKALGGKNASDGNQWYAGFISYLVVLFQNRYLVTIANFYADSAAINLCQCKEATGQFVKIIGTANQVILEAGLFKPQDMK